MIRMYAVDVTGKTWESDVVDEEMNDEKRQAFFDLMEHWRTLNNLNIEIRGQRWDLNPANLIAVSLREF